MERYQVILAYDGTEFYGFQRQGRSPSGGVRQAEKARTVQGVVEQALRELGWQGQTLLAAGRTDTGVHATGQVIAFDLEWRHSPDELRAALNAHLPAAVAASAVRCVAPDFHPRYAACSRRYCYRLYCQPVRQPLYERYAWRVWPAVQLEALQNLAQWLPGRHDFAAFGTPPRTGGSTWRTVLAANWQAVDPYLVFEVSAQAFLYHMVRHMVFAQVQVAQGILDPEAYQTALNPAPSGPSSPLQGLAPAQGLVLVEVCYAPIEAQATSAVVSDLE
jgi:tRNA pseudouridine38-40 synthase